jgi:hypothetical protein
MNEKFTWLLGASVARNGKQLVPGADYPVSDFGAEIVAEWVRTGAAAYPKNKQPHKSGKED